MAVKGMSSRLPPTTEKKEPEVEAETPKSDMPEAKKALPSPTVGVVSPMLSQRRVETIGQDFLLGQNRSRIIGVIKSIIDPKFRISEKRIQISNF